MVPPVDHPTRLSVRRACVIQFQADTVVEQGHLAGRVEHVVSGQATEQKYAEIDPHTGWPRGFQTSCRKVEIYAIRIAQAGYAPSLHLRVVATPYGWWQGCQELELPGYDPFGPEVANANLLIPNAAIDPISGAVLHRSQRCCVREAGIAAETAKSGA